jgi:hypothetical protein
MTVDYSATFGFGAGLIFTPRGGSAVTVDAFEEVTPPGQEVAVAKFTPLDGELAGCEQPVAGKKLCTQAMARCLYSQARYVALSALFGVSGDFLLTIGDGMSVPANGLVSKVALGKLDDTNFKTIEITFELAGGWTPTAES